VSDGTGRTLDLVPEAPFGVRYIAGYPGLRIKRAHYGLGTGPGGCVS